MTDTPHTHHTVSVTDKEKSTKEIVGEISAEHMKQKRDEALDKLAADVEVDGFRKGNAPRDVAEQKLGEARIMEEAANMALSEAYPIILTENGIRAIGQPHITITKLAHGDALGFTITTATVPEFDLPDYKKIASEVLKKHKEEQEELTVTDEELDETIHNVRTNVAQQRKAEAQKNFGEGQEESPDVKDEDLPELTDDFVKTLGSFSDVEDFKTQLRENIRQEKLRKQKETRRQAVAEKLIEKTEIDVPDVVVDGELQKMVERMKQDVEKAGLEFDDYLTKLNKTEEDIRGEWKDSAEKKAKMQLILNKIAAEETITPEKEAVENEMKQLKEYYPDAPEAHIQTYVETYMTNNKVLEFLEAQE